MLNFPRAFRFNSDRVLVNLKRVPLDQSSSVGNIYVGTQSQQHKKEGFRLQDAAFGPKT